MSEHSDPLIPEPPASTRAAASLPATVPTRGGHQRAAVGRRVPGDSPCPVAEQAVRVRGGRDDCPRRGPRVGCALEPLPGAPSGQSAAGADRAGATGRPDPARSANAHPSPGLRGGRAGADLQRHARPTGRGASRSLAGRGLRAGGRAVAHRPGVARPGRADPDRGAPPAVPNPCARSCRDAARCRRSAGSRASKHRGRPAHRDRAAPRGARRPWPSGRARGSRGRFLPTIRTTRHPSNPEQSTADLARDRAGHLPRRPRSTHQRRPPRRDRPRRADARHSRRCVGTRCQRQRPRACRTTKPRAPACAACASAHR